MEKLLGWKPIPLFDRDNFAELASMQVGFFGGICIPCYELLAKVMPTVQPMVDQCQANWATWKQLAEERKAELAKIRALQSYQEAKYRRQGKIKSKKFRKIARKEKEKEKVQELERLQATDPEAAKEKLEEMEKVKTTY